MKSSFLIPVVAFCLILTAQSEPLFDERIIESLTQGNQTEDVFQKNLREAVEKNLPEQTLLEAEFLYRIDRGDPAEVAALKPRFEKLRNTFSSDQSIAFQREEDWLAVVEYVSGLDALQKGDFGGFKAHLQEAFWLSPRQSQAYVEIIENAKLQRTLEAITVDLNLKIDPLFEGDKALPIKELIGKYDALLIQFWSPYSDESLETIEEFTEFRKVLKKKNVASISVLPETDIESIAAAHEVLDKSKFSGKDLWFKNTELANILRVSNAPWFVLISQEGKVVFHGHPSDGRLSKIIDQRISE